MYTAAKTALLGLIPGLYASLSAQGIRTGVICPWFAGMFWPRRTTDCVR